MQIMRLIQSMPKSLGKNIPNARHETKVEIKVGAELDSLAETEKEGQGKERSEMDFVYVDADQVKKVGYLVYGLKFAPKRAVVVVDT
ncbi:O-methyltransferase [Ciborinia camelliae]|nr:O-methyltransferase [Ciborinia camelliae]